MYICIILGDGGRFKNPDAGALLYYDENRLSGGGAWANEYLQKAAPLSGVFVLTCPPASQEAEDDPAHRGKGCAPGLSGPWTVLTISPNLLLNVISNFWII